MNSMSVSNTILICSRDIIKDIITKKHNKIEFACKEYFKKNKNINSRRRRFITSLVYGFIRYYGQIEYIFNITIGVCSDISEMILFFCNGYPIKIEIPDHIKYNINSGIFNELKRRFDMNNLANELLYLDNKAPTDIFITADSVKVGIDTIKDCGGKPIINQNRFVRCLEKKILQSKLFIIQDKGSQKIVELSCENKYESVIDYCCGSGGKSIGISTFLDSSTIYACDVDDKMLSKARYRLAKHETKNIILIDLKKETPPMADFILVDAPCSGIGSSRRNPEIKWLNNIDLASIVDKQYKIIQSAYSLLKKNGEMLYATCSLTLMENEDLIARFLSEYKDMLVLQQDCMTPYKNDTDGFFFCKMIKNT